MVLGRHGTGKPDTQARPETVKIDRVPGGGTEDALRETETRYQRLVENSPVGIFSFDNFGRITEANRAFFSILGTPGCPEIQEMPPRTLEVFFDPALEKECRECLDSGKSTQIERSCRSRSGKDVDIRLHLVPIRDSGGLLLEVQGIVEDMTERRKARELRIQSERIKAERELASGVAHNFNNLLQIVMGAARSASSKLDAGDVAGARDKLFQILESSQMGAQTVKRLQSFALSRVNGLTAEAGTFDLSDTARQAIEMSKVWWKALPEKHGMRVQMITSLEKGCTVRGQENELFEVIVNLIKNAAEALPRGGWLKVSSFIWAKQVILQVQDNGMGIPSDSLRRVFEPFFTTKGYESMGMGLAGSYGIVSRHRGEISVQSVPAKETTFTVKLPLADAEKQPTDDLADAEPGPRLRMLVIDDMQPLLRMLSEGLTELGQIVFSASSGAEGLRSFEDNQVDLVICDLGMPGMNGWEVGTRIRNMCRERGLAKPPFILLTGWEESSLRAERLSESGVDLVLEKPIDIPRLLKVVREVMDSRSG